ncbi:hypothetical protein AB0K00_09225 [Dactylosporangium sp. NPDC049525]|uniref:hypothetical protein n=1 Tax=Dactylosporangium sp. NPDC049525 TaxID=3154730 RepID=UPI0034393B2F
MMSCPACGDSDVHQLPDPPPRAEFAWGVAALTEDLRRRWTPRIVGGAAAVLLVVGLLQIPFTPGATSIWTLIVDVVLAVLLALAVLDRLLMPDGDDVSAPHRAAWSCRRCGRSWLTTGPAAPASGLHDTILLAISRVSAVARMIVLPWKPAAFLFSPRDRLVPPDRIIDVLSRVRVVLGAAIVVGVALWYRSYEQLAAPALFQNWITTGLLAIPTALIAMAVFVALTRAPLRRAALRQLRWPALSVLAFAGVVVLLFLFGEGANYVSGRLRHYAPDLHIPLDGFIYGGVFGLWLVVFCLRSAYLVGQHWFNTVDGHPLLPPTVATGMAWLTAGSALLAGGAADHVPGGVSLVLILGGAAATTATAALETWQTVRRHHVTVRDGPWPRGR